MYMTFFAASPCAKTVSFFRNLSTFLPRPAESRNNCTSKAELLEFSFLEERPALTDARRTAEDTINQASMYPANCTILNSSCRPAPQRLSPESRGFQGWQMHPNG